VVVAGGNVAHVIGKCLSALRAQTPPVAMEVIVASGSTDDTAALVRRNHPEARLLHRRHPETLPALRAAAIAETNAEVVAVIDAFSIVEPRWASALLEAHRQRPEAAIGGVVDLYDGHSASIAEWASFLSEYGAFVPPRRGGPSAALPGCNISYKRTALPESSTLASEGFWKAFENLRLQARGEHLWLCPNASVRLQKRIPFGDFLQSRFHHRRCFAGKRLARVTTVERVSRAATAPALALVLTWRLVRDAWESRNHRDKLFLAMPWLFAIFVVWSWGELCGYLLGCGHSCERLFY